MNRWQGIFKRCISQIFMKISHLEKVYCFIVEFTPPCPFLGVSPDGILEYSCCETIFVIVIKFPMKATKMPLTQLARSNESFYMEYVNDEYILTENHA